MINRSCLLIAGIVLWWSLLETANRFADVRSIVMIDRQTFAFLVEHRPPLGKPTSRIEIRDHHFNLLRRSESLKTKPNRELVGSGPLYLSWLPDPTNKVNELHLLDTRDFSGRIVRSETPFAATSGRITRDGKWLILVADSKVNTFKMYSLPELKEVESIEMGGNFVRPLDGAFAFIDMRLVVLFDSGKFDVRGLPKELANARIIDVNEGAILYWNPQSTSIQGKPSTPLFVYWPKDNRTVPVYLSISNRRSSRWQLVNDGKWLISDESEGNSRFRVVKDLEGDIVCRIPLPNGNSASVQKLFFQELGTFNWQPITDHVEIWDAVTCAKCITFDLRRYLMPTFVTIVVLCVVWCALWWAANCGATTTFSGVLGVTVGLCTICTAFSILLRVHHSMMDRSFGTQLHLLVGYMVIPVASWWIAFANENWLARIAQSTILLGLSWLGSTTVQTFENFCRVFFVITPILLSAMVMSLVQLGLRPEKTECIRKNRIGIRDLMLLGVAVGFAMHMLGFTAGNRIQGPSVLAFLKSYPYQDLLKVIRLVLVITFSQAGLVLLCYSSGRIRIIGAVMFVVTFGWFCLGNQSTRFQFFDMLSYGFFIMLTMIPIPCILYWLTQGLRRLCRLTFQNTQTSVTGGTVGT